MFEAAADAPGTAPRPSPRPRRDSADEPRSPAAVALSEREGTASRGDLYHVCGSCRQWVDAIYYVLPQYPRTQFCRACATAIGQGPRPKEAGRG